MRITDAYVRDTFLFVKVYYDLEDFQFARRRAWASNSIDSSSGVGGYSVFIAPARKENARLSRKHSRMPSVMRYGRCISTSPGKSPERCSSGASPIRSSDPAHTPPSWM